jgi:quercetin dioxygenase-like cupin family protein
MQCNLWIPKGWGGEHVIINCDEYCGKILKFIKDRRNSIHKHLKKQETFYIQKGKVQLNLYHVPEDLKYVYPVTLCEGDSYTIMPNQIHNILALTEADVYEFSSHHSDDDTIKLLKGD